MMVLLLAGSMQANEISLTLHVETAGTLPSMIASSKKDLISSLTLTGNLNGTDILFIREMAGTGLNYGYNNSGNLSNLDISGAKIVGGGDRYYESSGFLTPGYDITIIPIFMFLNCHRLKSIHLPDGITSIADYAFQNCTSLTSISIPDNVTSIGHAAFENCTSLNSITIPDNVTSIGQRVFKDCTSLTSATIGNGVQMIDFHDFFGCSSLTSIYIGSSVRSIEPYAFMGCVKLNSFQLSKSNTALSLIDGVLFNAEKTALIAFPNLKSTNYTIPDNVQSIAPFAFCSCSNLKSITIPNSVTSIGESAFSNCTGLTSVTIPNSIQSIPNYAFNSCTGLTSVTIGNSVASIGEYAFEGCSGLISVQIPDCVTSIGKSAFYKCTGLATVTIGNGLKSIGQAIFSRCTGLTSVTIGSKVTSIQSSAFWLCNGLKEFQVSEGNTTYSQLDGVLLNYEKSTLINFPKSKSTSYSIPNTVTSIGDYAFYKSSGLTSVTIPNSVTSIGAHAFDSCRALTTLTIGNSVTTIGDYAFSFCDGLQEIHNNSITPQIISFNVLSGVNKSTCKLYVPEGSYTAYWVSSEWGNFTNIIEDITSVSKIGNGSIKVYTEGDAIVMEGAEPGEQISVYTETGTLVTTAKATDGDIRINVPAGHTYLIRIANQCFKVTLYK